VRKQESSASTPTEIRRPAGLCLDALEPRVLFSGAPVEGPDAAETADSQRESDEAITPSSIADQTGSEQGASLSGEAGATLVATDAASADLNAETLAAIADAAKQRWIDAGISVSQIAALDGVTYQISDLSGNALGKANGFTITIDRDAAGSNAWFIDATPLMDEEFETTGATLADGGAAGAYDLLSTVLHEQGHVLGLADVPGTGAAVMNGLLNQGQRRTPAAGAATSAVVGSVEGDAFLGGTHLRPDPATEPTPMGGTGTFSDSGQSLGNHATRSVALGDLDGDGDLDLIEGNNGHVNRVLLNDGLGTFADSGQTLGTHGTWMIALGDLDGDGDLDFVEANGANPGGFTQPNRVWMNDGLGSFTDSGQLLENLSTGSIALGDLDNDGDLDLIEGNYNGPNFAWFNDGSGIFVKGSQSITSASTESIALGDVDGDGDLDLVEGNFNQANRVWLNSGTGSFTNSGQSLGIHATASIALGDLDGDGDLDMVEGNRNQPNRIWINDGAGTFAVSGQTLGSHSETVVLGDLDGDDDLDFIGGGFGQPNRVWLNDGLGSFTDSGQALGNTSTDNLALGDVDGDGDLDLVEGNNNQPNRVWINQGSGFTSTTTAALDGSGNLLITDSDGGDTDDTLTLVVNGTHYRISDATNRLSAGAGAVQIDDHTVEVAIASVTGPNGIIFDTLGGDDTLTVDFSGGDFLHLIDFQGGGGSNDALTLTGGASAALAADFLGLDSGELHYNGTPRILYSGLEAGFDADLTLSDLSLNYSGESESIALDADAAAGWMVVTSTHGQTIRFRNPSGTLEILGQDGDDTVTVSGFDAGFKGSLLFDGEIGNDSVNLNAGLTFATGHGLRVVAETITGDAGAIFATSGVGTIDLRASGEIVLTGSQLSTEDGSIFLITDHFDTLEPIGPGSATVGVKLDGATVTSTGLGAIDLQAIGLFNQYGVALLNGSSLISTGMGEVSLQGEFGGEASVAIEDSLIDTRSLIGADGGDVTITGDWGGIDGVKVDNASILAGGNVMLEGSNGFNGVALYDFRARIDAFGTVTLKGYQSTVGVYFAGTIGEGGAGPATNQGVMIEGTSTGNGGSPWFESAGVWFDGSVNSSGAITVTGNGVGNHGITTNYGLYLDNQSGISGEITISGTGMEVGVNLGTHSQILGSGNLTIGGDGAADGVRLGSDATLSALSDLEITGNAANGTGVSGATGTELNAGGVLLEIRGNATSTGTGVAFDGVSVNDAHSGSAAVTIVGTGGNAAGDRGIELLGGLVIGQGVSLTGTTAGETGLFLEDVEIYSDSGGPGDLTLEGQGGGEGVHLGASSYLVAGKNLTITGTAADGVGVSAGIGTEMAAGGTLIQIQGETAGAGTGVAFDGVSVNEFRLGNPAVTILGTGGSAPTDRGIELLNSLIIGQGVSLTGTTTGETGLFLEDVEIHSDLGGPGDLTLEGEGGTEGVHLGASSYLVAGQNLTITGTAAVGVGVSAGLGTEMAAGGTLIQIQGEVAVTGTGVAFDGVSVNEFRMGNPAVTILGTGGGASTDRGIELLDSLILGQGVSLTGTTTGETGLFFVDVEIHSNLGGPSDLTLEGRGGSEGVHLGTSSYLVAGQNLTITGTAAVGVGVSAGMGTEMAAGGTLIEIQGEAEVTGTGVSFDGVSVNQSGVGNPAVTILGTGGGAPMDRGVELIGSTITGNGITLDGTAGGDAGVRVSGTQLYSNLGSLFVMGDSSHDGVRFEGNNVIYAEERPEITGDVVFDQDSLFELGISGHLGTYTGQVLVSGSITIRPNAGIGLLPSYHHSFIPEGGQSYILFDNDGLDAISGTFAGLGEGGAITDLLGFGIDATISYQGGDGNDVVISTQSANTPPVLSPIGNQSIDEVTPLTFTATANDSDVPAQTLTYSLDAASLAKGMTINAATGQYSWTPTEAQSGAHSVTVTVTDNGPGALSDSETITVTVNEVNQAPILAAIGERSVDEGSPLNFLVSASDADLPAQTLTYSLDAASLAKGMTIEAATGAFAWTPGEVQDGTHTVTITVTDNGTGALSDSETFGITVNEVNQTPVLDPLAGQNTDTASTLSFAVTASDADLPFQTLAYSLDAGSLAKGMTIDAQTGQFSWSPNFGHGGSHSVTVTVTDNGPGNLAASGTFTVEVTVLNQPPTLDIDTAVISYTEDAAPTPIAVGGTVTDVEGNWNGGNLTAQISSGAVVTDRIQLVGGEVTVIGGNYLQIGGITIGRAHASASLGSAVFTVTFNSATTTAHVQSVLRALAIDSASTTDPVAGLRTVSVQVTDGGGLPSLVRVRTVEVIAVNDPPRFVDLGGSAAYLIGQGAIVLDQSSNIIDEERAAANGGAGNYTGTSLTVNRAGGADNSDIFSLTPISGVTQTGSELKDGSGITFATYTSAGGVLRIDFTDGFGGLPTSALVQKVQQAIAFDNPALVAGSNIAIEFTFDDGEAIATGQVGVTALDANSAGVSSDELIITTDGDGDSVQLTIADGVLRIRSADKSIIGGAGTATDANGDLYVNITGLNRIAFYLGASNDLISIGNLTGFTGELIINGGDGQDEIQFSASLVADADRNIHFAAEEVKLNGATLQTSGTGGIRIDSSGTGTDNFKGISVVNSTLRSTGTGTIEIHGEAGALGGASQGVRLSGSTLATTDSDILISGQGGGATSSNYGVVFESASTVTAGGAGNVTISGTGGGGGGSSGIQMNTGTSVTVVNGGLTLTGHGGSGSGNSNRGINLSNATILATGDGNISLTGNGGGTGSTSSGVYLSGGSVAVNGIGSISILGTGSVTGTNDNAGIIATNGLSIRTTSGNLTIQGHGGGTGSNNRGISLTGSTTLVQSGSGAIRLTGQGSLNATGNYAEGILIQAAGVQSVSGAIDITGTGGSGTSYLYGVRMSGGSVSTGGILAIIGQGGTGTGLQNAGVWLISSATTNGGASSSITGTGGSGSSKNHGVHLLTGTTGIPITQILGTAGTGTGSLDYSGSFF
jgi:hypothetical protein